MIETCDLPATILRPCYFMQNDAQQKDALLNHGVYGMPLGSAGLSVVDTRDIGEAAAKELVVRRPKQRALRKMMRGMKDRVLAASITGRLRPGSSQGLFDEKSAASAGKPPMTASDKSMPRSKRRRKDRRRWPERNRRVSEILAVLLLDRRDIDDTCLEVRRPSTDWRQIQAWIDAIDLVLELSVETVRRPARSNLDFHAAIDLSRMIGPRMVGRRMVSRRMIGRSADHDFRQRGRVLLGRHLRDQTERADKHNHDQTHRRLHA
jgi:hypothetical protein